MASQKISQFTPVVTLASGDFFPVVLASDGTNKRADVGVLDERYTSAASGTALFVLGDSALASGNAALTNLGDKYDKTGGPITGTVTTESRALGRPDVSGVVSGTIVLDFSGANNFEFTLASSGYLATPLLPSGGQSGAIVIRQILQGSGILSYSSEWKFPDGTKPELTTASSGVDVLSYYCASTSEIFTAAVKNFL
jgi:hypothetical protein